MAQHWLCRPAFLLRVVLCGILSAYLRTAKNPQMNLRVFAEISEDGSIVRIVKTKGGACFLPPERVKEYPRSYAVGLLREQVLRRANNLCDKCGKIVTNGTLQMHERIPKSKGGEQSMDNCWALCYNCHQGKSGEHKRHPVWTKR